jgi:hypothetical protein
MYHMLVRVQYIPVLYVRTLPPSSFSPTYIHTSIHPAVPVSRSALRRSRLFPPSHSSIRASLLPLSPPLPAPAPAPAQPGEISIAISPCSGPSLLVPGHSTLHFPFSGEEGGKRDCLSHTRSPDSTACIVRAVQYRTGLWVRCGGVMDSRYCTAQYIKKECR